MKLGESFEGVVRDLTSAGQGVVAHPSGRTVFVAGVWLEEVGEFKIDAIKGRVAFASIIRLIKPSPYRRDPSCKYQGTTTAKCGGCPWMIVTYSAQLEAKFTRVRTSVARIDESIVVNAIWPSEKTLGYRNRVQFKSDGSTIGFVAPQSNQLVPINSCEIISEKNQETLANLRDLLPNKDWRPHKKNKWVTLDVDESVSVDMVSVNKRLAFKQANTEQNLRMQDWVSKRLEKISDKKKALELFCGSGNFTGVLAKADFEKIIAVEGVEQAVDQLRQADLDNVELKICDLYSEQAFYSLIGGHKDASVLFLDPPREGLKIKKGFFDKKSQFNDVLYVSCDLATFTRDLREFIANGYKVLDLQPLDQFPQTPHVEILCHLHKKLKS